MVLLTSCDDKTTGNNNKVFFSNGPTRKTPYYAGMTIEQVKQILGSDIQVLGSLDYNIDPQYLKDLKIFKIWDEERQCILYFNFYQELHGVAFKVH